MGGKVLTLPSEIAERKGRREGKKEGIIEGKKEGIKIGEVKGEELKLIKLILKKLSKGKDALTIADELDEELRIIEEIVAAVSSCETDATPEDVYEKLRGNQEKELTAV